MAGCAGNGCGVCSRGGADGCTRSDAVSEQTDGVWLAEEGSVWLVLSIESVGAAEVLIGSKDMRVPRLDLRVAPSADPTLANSRVIHLLLNPETKGEIAFANQLRDAYKFARGQ